MIPENLPAVPGDTPIEGTIVNGRPLPATTPMTVHPAVRHAGRHGLYVAAGAVVLARRWHRARTIHHRMAEMSAAAGDHKTSLDWMRQHALVRHQRHERARGRVEMAVALLMVSWIPPLLWLGFMVAWGLAEGLSMKSLYGFWVPWPDWAHAMLWTLHAVVVAFLVAAVAIPFAVVAVLHHHGRHPGEHAPGWLATSADPDTDVTISEVTITKALADMRFPQVSDYLKGGMPLQFLVPCRQEGRGTFARLRLPGIAAEKVVRRRTDLAAGLYRQAKEVWPSIGAEAAILDLWIADKGALAEGAGDYPLLRDGLVNVFRGVPFGRTLRGDPVTAPLMERNTLAGGMPGQGKSSAARVLLCGAALDVTAELWVMIPDTNFDFEVMKRRCSRYVMGAEDERLETIRDWLLDLRDEVQARGQLLVDFEQPAVTRKLASAGAGLHPMVVLLEEAHVAITHKTYGKEIAGLLTDVVKLGRKRGIHVIVSTQAPTRDSMPRDVTRNCSNGIAFAVGDHVANDALLGQGAYAAGHRATELIPGADRGTALVKGFTGERSDMVQVYYLDVARGHDQVTPIVDRSLAEMARLYLPLPGSPAPLPAIEARDLLADLDEVTRTDTGPVRLSALPHRLRQLAKSWDPYKSLTAIELRDLLEQRGVRVTRPGNVMKADPLDIRRALNASDGGDLTGLTGLTYLTSRRSPARLGGRDGA